MSTLTKVLERNVAAIEKNADMTEGRFRLGHHLMPPVGWLNDPNGLCWYKGKYHVFFQYAPFDVEGGLKFWGHYTMVFIPVLRWWTMENFICFLQEMSRLTVITITSMKAEKPVHFMLRVKMGFISAIKKK